MQAAAWAYRPVHHPLERLRSAAGLVMLLVVISGWFLFLRPQSLAGPAVYVRVSGTSMQPVLEDGDLVFVLEQDAYEIGDVVAYHVPEGEVGEGAVVLHRIVGGSVGDGFVLQGDNREGPDVWRPRPEAIDGSVVLRIPGGGRILGVLGYPPGVAVIAGLLTYFLVMWVFGAEPPKADIRDSSGSEASASTDDALGDLDGVQRRSLPEVVPAGEQQQRILATLRLADTADEHIVDTGRLEWARVNVVRRVVA